MGQRITLESAVNLFILDSRAQGHTPNTQRYYSQRLRIALRWLHDSGTTQLDELTAALCRAFLAELQSRDLSDAYIHSIARALRAFFNFCVRDGLLDESPFDKVKMPRHRTEVRDVLRMADFKHLLDAATCERDRAILCLLLDTGLRASEALTLNVVDVDGQTVTVRSDKGGRGRFVYIGARTEKQLARYFAFERDTARAREPLFTTRKGQPKRLAYFGLASIFRRLRLSTGINVSPHMLRRTYAVESLRNGMNIYLLARLMGHADINTLRHYLKYVDRDIRQASERYGVVDNL